VEVTTFLATSKTPFCFAIFSLFSSLFFSFLYAHCLNKMPRHRSHFWTLVAAKLLLDNIHSTVNYSTKGMARTDYE
jgi:ABC-type sugar transport system permease subunit